MEYPHIKVLLLSNCSAEVDSVREFLQKSISPNFLVHHCYTPQETINFLLEDKEGVDIVLLDLGLIQSENAEKMFQQIHGIVEDLPVIIFTGASEHDLAMLIVKEGVADNITREIFAAAPESLKNAIESSLSRNNILQKLIARAPAALEAAEKIAATSLRDAEKTAARELILSEETAASELKTSEEISALELKEMHVQHKADREYHKQVLSWMSGGYSVTSNTEEDSTENVYEQSAAELNNTQKATAVKLKEDHRKGAEMLRESQKMTAAGLLQSQVKLASMLKDKMAASR